MIIRFYCNNDRERRIQTAPFIFYRLSCYVESIFACWERVRVMGTELRSCKWDVPLAVAPETDCYVTRKSWSSGIATEFKIFGKDINPANRTQNCALNFGFPAGLNTLIVVGFLQRFAVAFWNLWLVRFICQNILDIAYHHSPRKGNWSVAEINTIRRALRCTVRTKAVLCLAIAVFHSWLCLWCSVKSTRIKRDLYWFKPFAPTFLCVPLCR